MSKRSSLMEAAKQNKKKTAIIAVVVVLVLAAPFMRFKGGAKEVQAGGPGGPAVCRTRDRQCGDGCG